MSYNEERMIAEAEMIEDYQRYPEELATDDADDYDKWRDQCCENLCDDLNVIKKLLKHHLTKNGYYKGRVRMVKEELLHMYDELQKEVEAPKQ
jgi:hypothetical protein